MEIKSLSEISENLDSKRVPITKSKRISGNIPYYGASGIVDYVHDYLFDEDLLLVSEDGANLVARTYPIAFSISGKTWVNNHAHVLRFQDETTRKYVEYYLNSISLLDFISGMAQPKLNQKKLNSIPIPIPSLQEQKQIVKILDEAFAAIDQAKANIEKNIENAEELFNSKLNSTYSESRDNWPIYSFQELSSRIGDGLHGTPSYDENGEYYFINGNNLNDGCIDIKENTKRVNEEEYNKHIRPLTNNTVLVSINGTLGKVAFYNDEPVILGKSACYINFDERVNKRFIKYLIKSPLFFSNMAKESTGATIKNFSLKSMRNYTLNLPSLEEQEEIVENLMQIDHEIIELKKKYSKKLEGLEELKNSILQKAFSGELTSKESMV